jgi:hypothetical protein
LCWLEFDAGVVSAAPLCIDRGLRNPSSLFPKVRKPNRGNAAAATNRLRQWTMRSCSTEVLPPSTFVSSALVGAAMPANTDTASKAETMAFMAATPSWNDADDTLSSCIAESSLLQPRNLSVIRELIGFRLKSPPIGGHECQHAAKQPLRAINLRWSVPTGIGSTRRSLAITPSRE